LVRSHWLTAPSYSEVRSRFWVEDRLLRQQPR